MKLTELDEQDSNLHIFCDLDGVLVDFHQGVVDAYYDQTGERVTFQTLSKGLMWKTINRAGERFWADMKWTHDGPELWNYIKKYKPTILSAPHKAQSFCIPEKEEWVETHLGSGLKVICDPEKFRYAAENHVLIDDTAKKIIPWQEADGIGVFHTTAGDTIRKLKELGL